MITRKDLDKNEDLLNIFITHNKLGVVDSSPDSVIMYTENGIEHTDLCYSDEFEHIEVKIHSDKKVVCLYDDGHSETEDFSTL